MAGNTYGNLFRITTFGESHGRAVGVIVDGVPPNLELEEQDIQRDLDRRKPGQSVATSPRNERDKVQIVSGVYEGKTTGTPVTLLVMNEDMDSSAYVEYSEVFRPGQADFSYQHKYGFRDHRGSGRASGRETVGRVAAGAIARKILSRRGVTITAYTYEAAGIPCEEVDLSVIEKNPMRACDLKAAELMVKKIERLKEEGDSAGGIVECRIAGLEPGLGEPVFDKLDAELAKAMMSIGAVKGIEFGAGFSCADMTGSEHNDWMDEHGFGSNNAGGILGGISTGMPILFRIAVKPTPSIGKYQKTVDRYGNLREISIRGRHDACICPRIVPVVEAMAAIVIEDFSKIQASART